MPDGTDNNNPAQGTDGETQPVDFAAWLETQPENIKAAYADHTKGLKGALDAERAEKKRLEAEQKAKAKQDSDAEKTRLAEQQKWQELAETLKGEKADLEKQVGELTPTTERVAALEKALGGYLEAERKGLPKHVLALLDKLDVVDQLEYIAANREALKPTPTGGIPPTPRASGPGKVSDEDKRKRAVQPRL